MRRDNKHYALGLISINNEEQFLLPSLVGLRLPEQEVALFTVDRRLEDRVLATPMQNLIMPHVVTLNGSTGYRRTGQERSTGRLAELYRHRYPHSRIYMVTTPLGKTDLPALERMEQDGVLTGYRADTEGGPRGIKRILGDLGYL